MAFQQFSLQQWLAERFFRPALHRWLRLVWLAVVLASATTVVVMLSAGRQFDTSILALLPEEDQSAARQLAKDRLADAAASRLVFVVGHAEAETSLAAAEKFARQLQKSQRFAGVQGRLAAATIDEWTAHLWPYRYNYLTPQAARQLREQTPNDRHPVLQTALARLYSPLAATVAQNLVDDPLQLFYQWQLQSLPKTGFRLDEGWLTREADGRVYRLITATLQASPYSMSYQTQVADAVTAAQQVLPTDVDVLRSGLLFHAHFGAQQAQREISTIGLGSLAGIALLLVYVLRRLRPVLLAFLPLFTGLVFSFAICLIAFERLHLITLAFGAGLVGVAIDYSLHYLCADFETGTGAQPLTTIQRIFPAITLGLVSSTLAYAAQAAAPFPGLRQMALFSALGLLGAWLTVVLWLPFLRRRTTGDNQPGEIELGLVGALRRVLKRWPTTRARPVQGILVVVIVLSAWQIGQLQYDDSIRRLQTSPGALLAEDARVQTLLGGLNPGQYFVVSAADEQTLLKRQEALHEELNVLVQHGELNDHQSIARWVPSRARQESHRQLQADSVFSDAGLLPLLGAQLEAPALVERARAQFAAAGGFMTVANWLDLPASAELGYLWLGEAEGQVHALVALAGIRSADTLAQLSALSDLDAGIVFVDNVGTISTVLEHHRRQLQRWLVVAYGFVLALLVWRYGKSAWRLVAAPAIASGATLALLSFSGAVLNIFNLLALLLVLGIGLDASIFLRESGRSVYTWVAVSLAAATTLLAFGLLSLSATPVLHQFGITVLLGIVGVWLLAPCFVITPQSMTQQKKV